MPLEQFGEHRQNIIALELGLRMDRQALPRVLVDHGKHAERLTIARAVHDEVVASHMTRVLRSKPHAGAIVEPEASAPGPLLRDFEPFTSSYPLDPFSVHQPTLIAKQCSDLTIDVPAYCWANPVLAAVCCFSSTGGVGCLHWVERCWPTTFQARRSDTSSTFST